MKINSINNFNVKFHLPNSINFRGENFNEYTDYGKLIHETAFFREPNTDEFVKAYLENTFLKKDIPINIVVGACSVGNEAYSQAMLFDEYNDKVSVLGFDLGPEAIKKAKTGRFIMQDAYRRGHTCICNDAYLVNGMARSERQKRNKAVFNKYFKKDPVPVVPKTDINAIYGGNIFYDTYKLQDGALSNCSFELGDITRLDNLLKDNSTHCLFFRNALYHLVCYDDARERRFKINGEEILKNIANQASKKLTKDGLFVFGEHENKQGINLDILNKVMLEAGFEPLFISDIPKNSDYTGPRHTNIWRKVG